MLIDLLKTKTGLLVGGACLAAIAGGGLFAVRESAPASPYLKPFKVSLHFPNWAGDTRYGFDGKTCDLTVDLKKGCLIGGGFSPGIRIKLHDADPTKAVVTVFIVDGATMPDLEKSGVTWEELQKGLSFRDQGRYTEYKSTVQAAQMPDLGN
ncbi:MAG: hypothetical protein EPN26_03455 [Rhodospirillales bacterium]|nr:MAG: hypothetical protein EPN26_03455 [Rhodospirillales bacterium]